MYSISNLGGERNRQTTQVYKAVSKQTGKVLGAKREVLLEGMGGLKLTISNVKIHSFIRC